MLKITKKVAYKYANEKSVEREEIYFKAQYKTIEEYIETFKDSILKNCKVQYIDQTIAFLVLETEGITTYRIIEKVRT